MRIFSTLSGLVLITQLASGQTQLFSTDFDQPSSFELNTTDVGSVSTGANTWLVNAVYAGGDGTADCSGFELPYSIPATPAQPGTVPSPNGAYLHVASTEAVNDGITCCSFGAADGFCTMPGDHFARMAQDISTVGQSEVELSFWWLCNGGTSYYGEVYYSTDGGSDWNLLTTPIAQYRNVPNWTQQTISIPAFAGQPALRFGFRFVNQQSFAGGADPGFAVDAIRIMGSTSSSASIATPVLTNNEICTGISFGLPFTTAGTFNAGNEFTAELSDGTGSFVSPTTIGSLQSTSSGTIACTVPAFIVPGGGYRIRVVADAPAVESAPTVATLTVFAPAFAGTSSTVSYCSSGTMIFLFDELGGAPATCGTWNSPTGLPFDGTFQPGADPAGVYTYSTDCGGPCPASEATVTLVEVEFNGAGNDVEAAVCADGAPFSPYTYISGGATTGQFLYQGAPFPLPDFGVPGTYALAYVVQGSAGCGNDTAAFVFDVMAPANAGTSLSYTTCITTPAFPLISLLGVAQENGSWTDPSGEPFGGLLDPATDVAGLYTYTVQGAAPCPDDQAFVALVIDPCSGLEERGATAMDLTWLGQEGTAHQFVLHGTHTLDAITCTSNDGRSVQVHTRIHQGRLIVEAPDLATGAYVLRVQDGASVGVRRVFHQTR